MFSTLGTALRFFLLGLCVGVLTAPRSGQATRELLGRRIRGFAEEWGGATTHRPEMMTPGTTHTPYRASLERETAYSTEDIGLE